MQLEGFAPVMETVRNNAAGLKGRAIAGPHDFEQIPALVERGRQRVADFFDDLEARLAAVSFVAGDPFSVADITAVLAVDFAAKALSLTIPEAHAATNAWYAQFSARPSMAAKYCRRRPSYIPPFQEFHHGSTNRQNPRP